MAAERRKREEEEEAERRKLEEEARKAGVLAETTGEVRGVGRKESREVIT